ncbi:MAG: DEAD/DEAH box helicase family protein [Anaerolineales bacterium]
MHLYEALSMHVAAWQGEGYRQAVFPAIAEILEWVRNPDVSSFRLRTPQVRALETYWYLRLVEKTPHIFELYKSLYPIISERMAAMGMDHPALKDLALDQGFDGIIQKVRADDAFVKQYHLEALRETLTLDYPSYILALAMGAGKTVLIGAIFASEFAMAQEYPDCGFVENALVFAPGKTIIESLRELAEMRYEAVLPPRMYKSFAAALKLTFTRDGDPDIPIVAGSHFNVVVTNTEKIRIQKETIRKLDISTRLFSQKSEDEARAEIANLRLQRIASLPDLAIFSDEAHHTYCQAMDSELKKVRKTVDYLHNPHVEGTAEHAAHETKLICVINTTGTPYFKHQALKDVVLWYGLSEGIRDGILKEVGGNIRAFDFEGNVEPYIEFVIEDFFREYGAASLPDGTPAKLALFFPQTDDVEALRGVVESKMVALGYATDLILEHHTAHEEKDEFDRFRNSPKRVALLVSRGVEGWNVPALFACALARKLSGGGNNFVLQAASRCLRQVPGNTLPARIYLSMDNRAILDSQLQESYGETINDLNGAAAKSRPWTITLRKVNIPPLVVRKQVRSVTPVEGSAAELILERPVVKAVGLKISTYTLAEQASTYRVLQQMGETITVESVPDTLDLFAAAVELASNYHLSPMSVQRELNRLYGQEGELPRAALTGLAEQIEKQTRKYVVREETVEVALALVKPEGFKKEVAADGVETYTAEIQFPVDRQNLLTSYQAWQAQAGRFGFHYDPYNFDSHPEEHFFEQMLVALGQSAGQVDDIYFTGALTDPQKTDFYVEYKGLDGAWHRYSPDFLIRLRDGKCLIVEIKREHDRQHPVDGETGAKAIATRAWANLNPDRLKYEMIFTSGDELGYDQLKDSRAFIAGGGDGN